MAHINRRFIDKHWLVFVIRGGLAVAFGFLTLFGGLFDLNSVIALIVMFLLVMGIVDAVSALYSSTKKHGWINSVIDALIDVVAAVILLFAAQDNLVVCTATLAAYTFGSGIIDVFHAFLSTIDPTDRFMRIIAGVLGAVIGAVILNSGDFEMMTFVRFFGVYMLIIGVISMIYGVHNRSQEIEDKVARSQSAKKSHTRKK